MSVIEIDEIELAAFRTASREFKQSVDLTPDEDRGMRAKLREYIHTLRACGETDPQKMASAAVALVRQFEQVLRSQERIDNPGILS